MESRFGADFSDVRVHTGSAASEAAAMVGGRAYTIGRHVVLGGNGADKRLLAHELAHVIQQRNGQVTGTEIGGGLKVSDPSDRFERDAESNAARVMRDPPGAHGPAAADLRSPAEGLAIQRYPLRPSGEDSVPLRTYEDVIKFINGNKEIARAFRYELSEPRLVEDFLRSPEINNYEYEDPADLLEDLASFMEADEEESGEEESPEPQTRTERKGQRKNRKQRALRRKPRPTPEQILLTEFGGMSGKESTKSLNPVNFLQEDILSNLYQSGSFRHEPGGPNLKRLSVARDFLESKDTNYKKQLEAARAKIIEGRYLVRKMSAVESRVFRESGGDGAKIFPEGIEGMKAFRIDEKYKFKDAERNAREQDYEVVMLVRLSARLKTYFVNFLSANVVNPLGIREREFQFGFNPQFKYENNGPSILIPRSGWTQFWSFVENDTKFETPRYSRETGLGDAEVP
jgi:hypothetical protein